MRVRDLAKLLQVVGAVAHREGILNPLILYIKRTISLLNLPYTLSLRNSVICFCNRNSRDCLVAEVGSDGLYPLSVGSSETAKTFLQLAIRFIGTRGRKKIVSLYVRSSDVLTKLSPKGMEKLIVLISRAAQLLIVLFLSILLGLLVMIGLPPLTSIVTTLALLNMLMLVVPEIAIRCARLTPLMEKEIYKVEVVLPESAGRSVLSTVLGILRSVEDIKISSLNGLALLLREVSSGEVNIRRVVLSDEVARHVREKKIKILVMSSDRPDAFSILGLRKYIVVTTRLLALLDSPELDAVIAHEIGHLARIHIPLTLLVASVLYVSVPLIVNLTLTLKLDLAMTSTILALFMLSSILASWSIIRRLEIDADLYAVKIVGPHVLARALISVAWRQILLELEKPGLAKALSIFSTHPPVLSRLITIFSRNM